MEKVAYLRNKKTGAYIMGSTDDSEIVHELPAGLYRQSLVPHPLGFHQEFFPKKFNEDLVKIDKDPYLARAKEVVRFFDSKTHELYQDLKMKHFLGVLFYGAPGSGKTCFTETLVHTLVSKYNSIAVLLSSSFDLSNTSNLVDGLRDNESQHITLIADEFDKFTGKTSAGFLAFLDGYYTKNNVCFLATTNRFSMLSDQLTNRKSRFAIVQELSYAPLEIVEKFIHTIIPEKYSDKIELPELLSHLDGKKLSLDDVKYVILDILKNGSTPAEAISKLETKPQDYEEPED